MVLKKKSVFLIPVCLWLFLAPLRAETFPSILSQKESTAVFNQWLKIRLERLLPEIMKRENLDMWIVISRENNEDPVFYSLVPAEFFSSWRLYMLVFCRQGDGQVERISVSRYGAGDLYKEAWDPAKTDQWECLGRVVKERKPLSIGIDEADTFALGDGLSATMKKKLVQVLGPEYASRLCSAEKLAVGWLERRSAEELEVYPHIAAISHRILSEAFSNQVITPGVTSTEDVLWWLREKVAEVRLKAWAQPNVSIQRPKDNPFKDNIIRHGDLLTCDFVLSYLHLCTDTKVQAYVLRAGEADCPEGLKKALAEGNRLQDILVGEFKENRTGNEILASALKKAKEAGIKGTILCHPVGFYGHSAGPAIGLWDMQTGVPGAGDCPLHYDTCQAIELTARSNVPEWGNQEVLMELEEDAVFGRNGVQYLDGRQTNLILIKS